MTLLKIDTDNKEIWFDYISNQPRVSVFHHPGWIDVLEKSYGYRPFFITSKRNGELCAGLPFMEINSKITGRRWISLPFTDYYEPLSTCKEGLEEILEYLAVIIKKGEAPDIEIRWNLPGSSSYLSQKDVIHFLKLDNDYQKIKNNFSKTSNRHIKTAKKKGVVIEFCQKYEHLREYYRLHTLTRKRQGMPVQPWTFFENLFHILIEKNQGFILLASHEKKYIAGALFLFWEKTLTLKYAASIKSALLLRPNNLVYAEAIRWGCENGFTLFDFGKTDCNNQGLRSFKSHWGAEETPLIYTHLSRHSYKEQKNSFLMNGMNLIIQNSPQFVTRWIGELFYKDFA